MRRITPCETARVAMVDGRACLTRAWLRLGLGRQSSRAEHLPPARRISVGMNRPARWSDVRITTLALLTGDVQAHADLHSDTVSRCHAHRTLATEVYRTIVHDQPEWHVAWTWPQPWALKAGDRPSPLRVSAAEWTPSRGRGGSFPIPLRVSDVKSGRARPGSSLGRGRRASLAYAARGPCDASARVYDRTPGS